jgi:hypothetical protein
LEKLLYHHQVLGVIKRHRPPPISESELDALVPYLPCVLIGVAYWASNDASTRSKLLWNSTKVLILKEILATSTSNVGAEAIVKSELPLVLVDLLQCQDAGILEVTCSVFE